MPSWARTNGPKMCGNKMPIRKTRQLLDDGPWNCEKCTFENVSTSNTCSICHADRPWTAIAIASEFEKNSTVTNAVTDSSPASTEVSELQLQDGQKLGMTSATSMPERRSQSPTVPERKEKPEFQKWRGKSAILRDQATNIRVELQMTVVDSSIKTGLIVTRRSTASNPEKITNWRESASRTEERPGIKKQYDKVFINATAQRTSMTMKAQQSRPVFLNTFAALQVSDDDSTDSDDEI